MTETKHTGKPTKVRFSEETCRGCGRDYQPIWNTRPEFTNVSDGLSIRCPDCGKTNRHYKITQ